jgi:hypothetical protein
MILSKEVISTIDQKYFQSGLLVNLGKENIDESYVMVEGKVSNFYKKPPSGIPKTHLDKEVNLSLKKADNSIQKGNVNIKDLDKETRDILNSTKSIQVSEFNASAISNESVVIKERQLEKSVRDSLDMGRDAFSILQEKIGYDQLTTEVQYILDKTNENIRIYWKDPVQIYELLPQENNEEGDIRLVVSEKELYFWDDDEKKWNDVGYSGGGGGGTEPSIPDGTTPTPIVRSRLILGEFFADEGQQIFKLQDAYIVGSDDLQVLLNGILMAKDEDYIEVDERTIQLIFPLEKDDYVVFSVSQKDMVPYVVVEKHFVDFNNQRVIMLNKAIGNNPDIMQVFLNGIAVSLGENKDYLIYENKYVKFNYDLEIGDIVIARFETSSLADNFEFQFAQMQRVYMNVARQLQELRERVEDRF